MNFLKVLKNRTRIHPTIPYKKDKLWRITKVENRRWLCHQHKSCPHCGAIFYKWSLDHEPSAKREVLIFDWHSMELGPWGVLIVFLLSMSFPFIMELLDLILLFVGCW